MHAHNPIDHFATLCEPEAGICITRAPRPCDGSLVCLVLTDPHPSEVDRITHNGEGCLEVVFKLLGSVD